MQTSSLVVLVALGFALCACASPPPAPGYGTPMRWDRPARTLVLGEESHGDTTTPDARTSSTCKAGGRVGQAQDHLYGFEVKETATYRFELLPKFDGVIQVQQKEPDKPWYFGIGCAASG